MVALAKGKAMAKGVSAGEHWKFSVEVYGNPGVPSACLFLQDHYGLDISFLLVALYYVQRKNIDLTASLISELNENVRPFRDGVISKLRSSRRALKDMAWSAENERLREEIKKVELYAEQIEQKMISSFLEDVEPVGSPAKVYCAVKQIVSYFADFGTGGRAIGADAEEAIMTISQAVIGRVK